MTKTDIRDLRRILALTVIKDNPDDTAASERRALWDEVK